MSDQGDQPSAFPPTEDSIDRLHRSDWSTANPLLTGSTLTSSAGET